MKKLRQRFRFWLRRYRDAKGDPKREQFALRGLHNRLIHECGYAEPPVALQQILGVCSDGRCATDVNPARLALLQDVLAELEKQ